MTTTTQQHKTTRQKKTRQDKNNNQPCVYSAGVAGAVQQRLQPSKISKAAASRKE